MSGVYVILAQFVITLALIGMMVWLFAATKGHFTRAQWLAVYLCTAVITGILLGSLTHGSGGTVEGELLGFSIKLVGGAAVGFAFVLIAKRVTPTTRRYDVFNLPEDSVSNTAFIVDSDPDTSFEILSDGKRVLADFKGTAEVGWFDLRLFSKSGNFIVRRYKAQASGAPLSLIKQKELKNGADTARTR